MEYWSDGVIQSLRTFQNACRARLLHVSVRVLNIAVVFRAPLHHSITPSLRPSTPPHAHLYSNRS